ncbi:PQQ-dependent sugar dehydrogenase [Prosthecomicrobium sp. N25]|uniref:PQQ-dependent sugar dehydrogenase n=1 Tax=Prosthecomicrobium sp. N25 TaxID=3129254 RepID=UPI0030778253
MKTYGLAPATLAALATLLGPAAAQSQSPAPIQTEKARLSITRVATGLQHPWALAVMPGGDVLVTERPGRMRIVRRDGTVSAPIAGVPQVAAGRQGGLLDVTLHPDFASNRMVYFTFSEPAEGGNSTALARGVLSPDGRALTAVTVLFSQKPRVANGMHFGSRVVFDGRGHLYVTLGERFEDRWRVKAQELDTHLGKIVRLNEDGSVPADNPFAQRQGALPEIWSYGHRNVQAAAMNPKTGKLWAIEHGPRGGDEINIPEAGANYGWPVVSFGVNYDGTPVGTGKREAPGMVGPIYQWTPVIAPSGMLFYSGKAFPAWTGNLLVGGLATKVLVRLELDGDRVVHEERILKELGERIRDVAEDADGSLLIVTDEDDGKLVRIAPAEGSATGAARP